MRRRGYRIADTPAGMPFGRRAQFGPRARLGQAPRPRGAIAAIVVVVIVAAVIGAVVGAGGGTGGGSSHTGAGSSHTGAGSSQTGAGSSQTGAGSAATTGPAGGTSATAEVDRELRGVLRELASARATGLARQDAAGDAAQQAAAIATIADAYRRAAGQVAAISGSPPRLQILLADLESSYQSLATVARARSGSAYRRLRDRIDSDERQLRLAAASL